MTRAPFYRKCGVPVNGEQPLAFLHPCYVDGCEASAPFGFGVLLRAYRNRAVIVPTQAVINHCAELEMCAPLRASRDSVLDALIGKPKAKPTIGRRKAVI